MEKKVESEMVSGIVEWFAGIRVSQNSGNSLGAGGSQE